MDSLTLAATAVAATIMTKFWEKTGEKLGEKVFTEAENFLTSLKKRSPETASAIEKGTTESLDYSQVVLEVTALTETDIEIATATRTLAVIATDESNQELTEKVQAILETLSSQKQTSQNLNKLAEKIGLVAYGGTISIQTLNVD